MQIQIQTFDPDLAKKKEHIHRVIPKKHGRTPLAVNSSPIAAKTTYNLEASIKCRKEEP
jgi:hypothetical protein